MVTSHLNCSEDNMIHERSKFKNDGAMFQLLDNDQA